MSETETADVLEWRTSPWWAFGWAFVLGVLVVPFMVLMGWVAFAEIETMRTWAWPAYVFFIQLFVGLILGTLILAVLSGVVSYIVMLFDRRPFLRADREGVEVRMPFKPLRSVRWSEIEVVDVEHKRQMGRRTVFVWHVIFRLRDTAAAELTVKPQMAGLELGAGHQTLQRFHARYR